MEILRFDDLRNENGSVAFEGADHGDAPISFFVVEPAAGRGPSLHRHDYAELFIVLAGRATVLVGDEEREVGAEDVVVVPAGVPHRFSAAEGGARLVTVHASPRFVTEWIEEGVPG